MHHPSQAGAGGSRGTANRRKTQPPGGAQFVGHELYKRLRDFLRNYLVNLLKVGHFVCETWNDKDVSLLSKLRQ